ncbi:MAG: DNA adenine methylase, partial [Erysipelotrichaceae bacterium]|nr:DNA adenine methylase [Erysipelotrichaceae bacterium]
MKEFNINNRRYLGSKYKLIDFIHKVVDDHCHDITSVCDLFAGTGIVGYSFNRNYDVIVNDTLTTNEVAYYTFFDNEEVDKDKLMHLIDNYNNLRTNEDNYYSMNFADTYLSKDNMSKVGYIRD